MPQGRAIRQRLRDFLRWADAQRRCADLAVPSLGYDGLAAQIIADDKTLDAAAPMLAQRDHGSASQGGGALVLRYGQPTTHTVELTRDHLITGEAGGLPASENPAELWQE